MSETFNFPVLHTATIPELIDQWKHETRLTSNVGKKTRHPAYQQIIFIGDAAVPYLLADLETNGPQDWFTALTTITGENPITEDIAGNMRAMTDAWLTWGREKSLV